MSPNYFTEMCSGSEAGSYLRLIDCVHHSTLGSRIIKKKKKYGPQAQGRDRARRAVRGLFGVVTGCESPDVSSPFPRWRVVVVFALINEPAFPPLTPPLSHPGGWRRE